MSAGTFYSDEKLDLARFKLAAENRAQLWKIAYDATCAAGFTPDEALAIVMQEFAK